MTYHHFTVYGTRWWSTSLAIAQKFHADQAAVAENRPDMHWAPGPLLSSDRLPVDDYPPHQLAVSDTQPGVDQGHRVSEPWRG